MGQKERLEGARQKRVQAKTCRELALSLGESSEAGMTLRKYAAELERRASLLEAGVDLLSLERKKRLPRPTPTMR